MAESEDNKEISLYIFPVTDDLIFFFKYHFETLLVDNALWSCIYQQERPHKNPEGNYKDRGFWDPNSRNIYQKK